MPLLKVFAIKAYGRNLTLLPDVATRHSVNSCVRMTEDGGRPVRILMDLVTRCNRSLPHMEVVTSICEVLISLGECKQTRDFISNSDPANGRIVLKTSLEIMRIYKEKNQLAIFSKLCAFLWKMSHNQEFAKVYLMTSGGFATLLTYKY